MVNKMLKVISVLMIVLLLVGCGVDNNNNSSNNNSSNNNSKDNENGHVVRTDINKAIESAVGTLDPHYLTTGSDSTISQLIYETLYISKYVNNGGGYEELTYVPLLANDELTINEDKTVFTIGLRNDVTFSNGQKFTADDVVFSFLRAKESPMMDIYISTLESIKALDDYKVEITLSVPSTDFMLNLSNIYIMSKNYTEEVGEDISIKPCGTGPFVLDQMLEGQKVVLKGREDYYLGKPRIETVTYRVIQDSTTQMTAFEAGELDAITVNPTDWKQITESNLYETFIIPISAVNYITFNNEKPPFNDVRVRKAVNYAIDREALNDIVSDGTNMAAYSYMLPGTVFGATEPENKYEYNIEKAKALLKEAGYENGLTIEEPIQTLDGALNESAVVIQQMLSEVGIKVDVEMVETNLLVSNLVSGNYTMGTISMYLPDDFSYYGQAFVTEGIDYFNLARYSNPKVDELMKQIVEEIDTEKRNELCKEVTNITNDDAVYLPLFYNTSLEATNKNLKFDGSIRSARLYDFYWE